MKWPILVVSVNKESRFPPKSVITFTTESLQTLLLLNAKIRLFNVPLWVYLGSLGSQYYKCIIWADGPNPASFWFIFVLFHNTRTNIVQI